MFLIIHVSIIDIHACMKLIVIITGIYLIDINVGPFINILNYEPC